MSGRRVSPNVQDRLEHGWYLTPMSGCTARISSVRASRGECIAQEQRAFGGDQFADLHAFENLPVAVALLRRS